MMSNNEEYKLDLTEYNKLKELLVRFGVPFEENVTEHIKDYKHYQLVYPSNENRLSDAVIGFGTYGWTAGLLEQMGLLPDDYKSDIVEGWLDAETIFKRWAEDYGFFIKGIEI